jgi:MFS family permease
MAGSWPALTFAARWPVLLADWFVLGLAYSALATPAGRLLRRSSHEPDRPALFAAQFSLSHACWLLAYPLVGWLGARVGIAAALWAMAALAVLGVAAAIRLWPKVDAESVPHSHEDLPPDHPHLREHGASAQHVHPLVIDELHQRWPAR